MIIGVLKEKLPETRVSLVPESVKNLSSLNISVWVEPGAGAASFHDDPAYRAAGAELRERPDILRDADIILSLHASELPETLPGRKVLAGMFQPLSQTALISGWTAAGHIVFSLDIIPRITRAQPMDVLSSQANIAGYKAVLLAAMEYSRYFPMLMTAAGSIAPANVLIIGAGVAGLQAIATARRLGAVVSVFDTRPAVQEEVRSLGARFIEVEGAADASEAGGYAVTQTQEFLEKQQHKISEYLVKSDIVITTAQIPGKKAPVLISAEMIAGMRPGAVIVDLAAATGGNTALTRNNETVHSDGVTIIGNSALAATMPSDASKLYSKNITSFLKLIITAEGILNTDTEDEIVKGARCGSPSTETR